MSKKRKEPTARQRASGWGVLIAVALVALLMVWAISRSVA